MLARNHEHVHRRLRLDVAEGDAAVVLVEAFGRDGPGGEAAEETVGHGGS